MRCAPPVGPARGAAGIDQLRRVLEEAFLRRIGRCNFFDHLHVGMRYKNFKILTHVVASGPSPIQQLAIPHVYNLSVNPDEDTPYNYAEGHSWVLYKFFSPKSQELKQSLAKDSVPFGAPLAFNPYARKD